MPFKQTLKTNLHIAVSNITQYINVLCKNIQTKTPIALILNIFTVYFL